MSVDPRAFGTLEAKVENLTQRLDRTDAKIDRLDQRIADLTALLDRARGVRWFLALLVGLPAFLAGVIAAVKALTWR